MTNSKLPASPSATAHGDGPDGEDAVEVKQVEGTARRVTTYTRGWFVYVAGSALLAWILGLWASGWNWLYALGFAAPGIAIGVVLGVRFKD